MNSPQKNNRCEIPDDVRRQLQFTDDQLNEFREAFAVICRSSEETESGRGGGIEEGGEGSGGRDKRRVTGHQVEMILNICLNVYPKEEQIKQIVCEIDRHGSEEKSFHAMIRFLSDRDLRSKPEVVLRDAFELFDRDADGFLTVKDLKKITSKVGEKLTEGQIEEMIREADLNGDGKISYTEFVRMMSHPVK